MSIYRPITADMSDAGPAPMPKKDGEPVMSLRDWFAGQALAGILAFPGAVDGNRNKNGAMRAAAAYSYADAMIAERSK